MTREEAEEYAKEITYRDAINNLMQARSIPYRKATFIKFNELLKALEQEPKIDKYEYHTDHTDCIWYGNDNGCPVTCSQYRDGWNDAMDYIFKNGNGYQPYRHDG